MPTSEKKKLYWKRQSEKRKIDRKLNPDKYKAIDKKNREKFKNNPDKLIKRKEYLNKPEIKEKLKGYHKKYRLSAKGKKTIGIYEENRRKEIKIDRKINPEKYKVLDKKNREKIKNDPIKQKKRREIQNKYQNKKRKIDTFFRMRHALSSRLSQFLKMSNTYKKGSILSLIGCSKEFLKLYLEKKFYDNPLTKEKMTWKNYGKNGWEIDHTRPVSDFKLLDVSSIVIQKKIMHYSNLQPMWLNENRSKSDLIYLLKPNPVYKKILVFKEFNSNSTLKDLDEYVKKERKKLDPDLEIDLSVARNSKRQYLVWIKSKLEN